MKFAGTAAAVSWIVDGSRLGFCISSDIKACVSTFNRGLNGLIQYLHSLLCLEQEHSLLSAKCGYYISNESPILKLVQVMHRLNSTLHSSKCRHQFLPGYRLARKPKKMKHETINEENSHLILYRYVVLHPMQRLPPGGLSCRSPMKWQCLTLCRNQRQAPGPQSLFADVCNCKIRLMVQSQSLYECKPLETRFRLWPSNWIILHL